MKNYHTHTSRCHHAFGKDEDYVKEAIRQGYSTLGFSDHACWKFKTNYKSNMRMDLSQFDEYKRSILSLKQKYEGQIQILLGMEAEYYPEYIPWMKEFVKQKEIDYIILGNHHYLDEERHIYFGNCSRQYIKEYFNTCVEGLKTGLYAYLAHPELVMMNRIPWDEDVEQGFYSICKVCKEMDIPLEYNVLGMVRNQEYGMEAYPHSKFWKMASKFGNKAIIGMDAHQPQGLSKKLYEEAKDRLMRYDVEIIEDLAKIK